MTSLKHLVVRSRPSADKPTLMFYITSKMQQDTQNTTLTRTSLKSKNNKTQLKTQHRLERHTDQCTTRYKRQHN